MFKFLVKVKNESSYVWPYEKESLGLVLVFQGRASIRPFEEQIGKSEFIFELRGKNKGEVFFFVRVEGGGHRRRRWRPPRAAASPMKVERRR